MTVQSLLKELEYEESLCCTAFALYNLLRSYPATLFDRSAPSHEDFEGGLARIPGVGPLAAGTGLDDRALDAVAKALGLRGHSVEPPGSENDLRRLLASPGTGFLARLTLREGSESVAGVRHSVVLLPAEPERKPAQFHALESNGPLGETAHMAWKDLSRHLCGLYLLEVHGPRKELGNVVPGFGAARDLDKAARRSDITALRKTLAEFALSPVMGLEALQSAIHAHPQSGVLMAFRAAVHAALALKPAATKAALKAGREVSDGDGGVRGDLGRAWSLEPELKSRLPDSIRGGPWSGPLEAFATLGVLAVAPKDSAALAAKVQDQLRSAWS